MALKTMCGASNTEIALQKTECGELAIDTMSTTSPQHSERNCGLNSDSDMDDGELFSFSQIQPNEDVSDITDSDPISPKSNLLKHFLGSTAVNTNGPAFGMSQESALTVATPVPVRRRSDSYENFEASSGTPLTNQSHDSKNENETPIINESHEPCSDFEVDFPMCSQSSDTTVCDPYQAPNPWKRARKQHIRQQRQLEAVRQILTTNGGLQVIEETPDDWEEGQIAAD